MFSITGLEFSYSAAPLSMKSIIQAFWLMAVAIGNVIVVLITKTRLFENPANESFLFGFLMFIDILLFVCLAQAYKPMEQEHEPEVCYIPENMTVQPKFTSKSENELNC